MSRVVLLEFPDEADTYLQCERRQQSGDHVISLNPGIRSQLRHCGIDSHSTLPYFTCESHERGLRRSTEVSEWLRKACADAADRGPEASYANAVVWYVRYLVQECLWAIEVISNSVSRHKPDCMVVGRPCLEDMSGPYLTPGQRILGLLAQRCLPAGQVPLLTRSKPGWRAVLARSSGRLESTMTELAVRLATPFHYRNVVAQSHEHPVIFTTNGYNMENVARQVGSLIGEVPLLIRERPRSNFLLSLFRIRPRSVFLHEIWLEIWNALAQEDGQSRTALTAWLDRVGETIEKAGDVFFYKDVPFADIIATKFRGGIKPFILRLHRQAAGLQLLLDTVKPRAVISIGDREDDMLIGEACLGRSVPAMMISHGSHVPPRDELGISEWGEQARRMICAPYPYVGLQSRLAEEFVKVIPTSAVPVRTGPVVWGRPVQRTLAKKLRQAFVPPADSRHVVVHAGTPKWRGSVRFHVYETPDEYLQSLCDLARAVETLKSVHLVIRFRPAPVLSVEDVRSALPTSEKVSLSVSEPFSEVLGMADLLVSFSSTTIEEALLNRIPVLLYGGNGRYRHIPSVEVEPGMACPLAPVYAVKRADHLAQALDGIIRAHTGACAGQLFEQYRFPETETTSLAGWLVNGIGTGNGRRRIEQAESLPGVGRR